MELLWGLVCNCVVREDVLSLGRRLWSTLLESLHYSRPMLGAGSSSGVELFKGTGLWQTNRCFRRLFIPTFARCLSILIESPFVHKGFASCSRCPGGDFVSYASFVAGVGAEWELVWCCLELAGPEGHSSKIQSYVMSYTRHWWLWWIPFMVYFS